MGRWAQLHRLVPAFFARFFESELTAGTDDRKTTFFALLAILAMPGFMLPLLLASASLPVPAASGLGTDPSGWGWSMIAHYQGPEALRAVSRPDKVLYLGFAMIASGIVSLIAWNTLLIDRRDRIVLTPLPLHRSTVVIAKLVALLGYIFLIAVAMHALASLAFGIALAANNTVTFAGRGIAAHLIASVGASLFVMLSVVAVQGITLAAVGPRWFARISPVLQLCLVFLVISAVLSLPSIAGSVNGVLGAGSGEAQAWILVTPPLWFLGMYERLLGTSNAALIGLAHTASFAMALTAAAACGSYVLASRRVHASLADSDMIQVRRSTRAITVLTGAMGHDPQTRAAARFFLTTMARSHRHRLVLASAIGVAAAWGLPAWLALSSRAEAPQLASLSSVLTATMFVLVGLRISAWIPTDLRAAWTFELASLPRWTSRLAIERAMFALAVLPSVTLSSLTYWWLWGGTVALLHALFALAAWSLLIQALLWNFDGVPCTRRWDRDVLRLRHSWPACLAVLLTLAPGFAGLELLLLSRPLACLCTVGYMLTLAHSVRVASRARPGAVATDPVNVLTAALRSARLSPDVPREDTQAPAAAQPVEPSVLRRDQIERVTLREALARLRPPHVLRDVRFAFRRLGGAPVFTVFCVLTLGCGVGITTGVYSVVQTALWTSPPVADIDRLVHLEAADGRASGAFSLPDFEDLRRRQTAFSGLAAATAFQLPFIGGSVGEVVDGEAVNGGYFSAFGIRPLFGRVIHPSDDVSGAAPVAVLSHDVWRLRFGSDPSAIGSSVKIDGRVYDVVGIAPQGFRGWDFRNLARAPAVWVPLASAPEEIAARIRRADRSSHWLAVKGRLAPEKTIEHASADLSTIGRAIEAEFPTAGSDPLLGERSRFGRRWSARIRDDRDANGVGLIGQMFVGVVALVLLIGCTNLANLAIARGSSREHELAVRRALGASRIDLIREQFVESALIAAASGALAAVIIRLVTTSMSVEVPAGAGRFLMLQPRLDVSVLVFAALAGLSALVTFGVWPALQLTQTPARVGLSIGGGATPPHWHIHRRLIGWQVAASVALFLVAAACINVVLVNALHDTGVDVDRLAIVNVDFEGNRYDASRTSAAIDAVVAAASRSPAVAAAAAASALPFGGGSPQAWSAAPVEAPAGASELVQVVPGTPDIFNTLGVHVLHGRSFGAADTSTALPVAIVNEAFAIRRWGTANVVGRELRLTRQDSHQRGRALSQRVPIVGVAEDTDVGRTGSREHGLVYVPLSQQSSASILFAARTEGDSRAALMALRSALRQVDPDVVVTQAATGTLYLAGHYVVLGFVAALVTTLGALALLLAMTGLFGVISHAVARRTRELAVRLALGAEPSRIMRLVLADGLRPVIDGLVLGLFGGAICRAIITSTVSASVAAVDPIAFLLVPLIFVGIALAACYWPARRAARVDPNVALRDA